MKSPIGANVQVCTCRLLVMLSFSRK